MNPREGTLMKQLPADRDGMEALLAGTPRQTGALALAAAAAVLNRQQDLATALHFGLEHGIPPRHCYEALLQLYLFAGFPAALEALATFRSVLATAEIAWPDNAPEPYDTHVFSERGEELCRTIYTTAYSKMRERVGRLSPDLDLWMVVEGYGKTLSRPGLSTDRRELVIVAALAVLGWRNQLYSHIRGAVNVGVQRSECEAILHLVDRAFGISPQARAFDTLESVFA